MTQRYVIKMSDGQGFEEWYRSLSMRMQEPLREDARKFVDKAAADEFAAFMLRNVSSFAGCYLEGGGRLIVEVLPAE